MAEAWGLVYYLTRRHGESFTTYVRDVAERPPGVAVKPEDEIATFESHIGPPNAGFQRAWIEYMLKLRLDRREAGR